MNWFKENPVPAAILAFALLGAAATTYLALQASGRNSLAIDEFNTQISTLRRLQAKKPFPNVENEKKVAEAVNAYGNATTGFIAGLGALEAPLDPSITPQQFQDDLRNAVDALRATAAKNGVALPEEFFFGFDAYQTQLPTPQENPPQLYREFTVIRSLVEKLVALPVQSIDSLVRQPKPEKNPEAEPDPQPPSEDNAPAPFDSFTLGLTATQEKFIQAFNQIPESDAFLVLRTLSIENTNPVAPPRAEPTPAPAAASPFDTAEDSADEKLPVVFGREAVKATLVLEIPDFPGESTPATASEETPAPAN